MSFEQTAKKEYAPMKTPIVAVNTHAALDQLAQVYRGAADLGWEVLDALDAAPASLTAHIPEAVLDHMGPATRRALEAAVAAGKQEEGAEPAPWLSAPMTIAAQDFGADGFPAELAELPVTATILLGAVQAVAAEHGFDPFDSAVQKMCLAVMVSPGPLADEDGIDMATLAARIELTGITVHGIILRVSPRLTMALAAKLGAQSVPGAGPAAIAATNFAYTSYYQSMARVQFGLKALANETGLTLETLVERLRQRLGEDSLSALR